MLRQPEAPFSRPALNQFQGEDGRHLAYVKLGWFGGATTIMVEPEDVNRLRPYEAKFVRIGGELQFDPAKKRATFKIGDIVEVKVS
jgi:hypothetical protein